ncbi:hypothetical protein ACFE04_028800 [Oxalis oulophora]
MQQCGGLDCIWIAALDGIYLTDTFYNKDWLMYRWQKVGFETSSSGPLRVLTRLQILKMEFKWNIDVFWMLISLCGFKRFVVNLHIACLNRPQDNSNKCHLDVHSFFSEKDRSPVHRLQEESSNGQNRYSEVGVCDLYRGRGIRSIYYEDLTIHGSCIVLIISELTTAKNLESDLYFAYNLQLQEVITDSLSTTTTNTTVATQPTPSPPRWDRSLAAFFPDDLQPQLTFSPAVPHFVLNPPNRTDTTKNAKKQGLLKTSLNTQLSKASRVVHLGRPTPRSPEPDEEYVSFTSFTDPSFLSYQCGGNECIWKAAPDGIYLTDTYNKKDWLMYIWQRRGFESTSSLGPLRLLTDTQIWKSDLCTFIKGFWKLMAFCGIERSYVLNLTKIIAIVVTSMFFRLFMRKILHRFITSRNTFGQNMGSKSGAFKIWIENLEIVIDT